MPRASASGKRARRSRSRSAFSTSWPPLAPKSWNSSTAIATVSVVSQGAGGLPRNSKGRSRKSSVTFSMKAFTPSR